MKKLTIFFLFLSSLFLSGQSEVPSVNRGGLVLRQVVAGSNNLVVALSSITDNTILLLAPGDHIIAPNPTAPPLHLGHKNRIKIKGWGSASRIVGSEVGTFFTVSNCANIDFEDFQIVGNKQETGTVTLTHAILFTATNVDVKVKGIDFIDLYGHAVSAESTSARTRNLTIANCTMRNIGHPRVLGGGTEDGSCFNGAADNLLFTGNRADYCMRGVEIYTGSTSDIFTNMAAIGNSFFNTRELDFFCFGASTPNNVAFMGNICWGNTNQQSGRMRGAAINAGQNLAVMGNVMNGKSNVNIHVVTAGLTMSNIFISGNQVVGSDYSNIDLDDSAAGEIVNAAIIGNQAVQSRYHGIGVSGRNVFVAANQQTDFATGGGPNDSIHVFNSGQASNIVVTANSSANMRSATGNGYNFGADSSGQGIRFYNNFAQGGGLGDFDTPTNVVSYKQLGRAVIGALVASATILVGGESLEISGSGGAVTLTSTPSLTTNGIPDKTEITLIGSSAANTVTIQDNGTLAGSSVELGAASRVIGEFDTLTLIWYRSKGRWIEKNYVNN